MFVADSHRETLYDLMHGHSLSDRMINKEKMALGGLTMQTFALFTGSKGTNGTAYQDAIDMLSLASIFSCASLNTSSRSWHTTSTQP